MFADAVEVVIGSALILKNAVGLLGVLAIFLTILFPLLKLLAVVLVYRVGAALVQPLGAAAVGDCLQVIANTLTLFLVATAAVGLMFLITVTVIIGAGNVAVMLR
jgi:stage III sporulation protein AE